MGSICTRTCAGIASIYRKNCSDWWVQVPLPHFLLEYKQLVWSIVGGTASGLLVLSAIRKQARQARRGRPLYWYQTCAWCTTTQAKYSHTWPKNSK